MLTCVIRPVNFLCANDICCAYIAEADVLLYLVTFSSGCSLGRYDRGGRGDVPQTVRGEAGVCRGPQHHYLLPAVCGGRQSEAVPKGNHHTITTGRRGKVHCCIQTEVYSMYYRVPTALVLTS